MRVALVHDYIKEYGGAERVLETLHEMYPDAPVYTAFYSPEYLGPHKDRFKNWDIRTTWLQYVPLKNKLLSYFRFIAPFVFSHIDLSEFDVVITSVAGTYTSPNLVKIGKQTKLISYYHTPPRYLYGFATAAPWKSVWWRKILYFFGRLPMIWIRKKDIAAAQRPQVIIANSENVRERIKKFYGRDAVVVYPPVDVPKPHPSPLLLGEGRKKEEYFVAGGRLARPKHIDLAIKAAIEMGFALKVFGKEFSGYGNELRELAKNPHPNSLPEGEGDQGKKSTIQFLGEVTDEERNILLAGAKAYIFPAEDEDFGILPVEAMGVGTPVIAYKSGGPKETVIDPSARSRLAKPTGVFFDELSVKSLIAAVKRFALRQAQGEISPKDCIQQAKKFSKEEFIKNISSIVSSVLL